MSVVLQRSLKWWEVLRVMGDGGWFYRFSNEILSGSNLKTANSSNTLKSSSFGASCTFFKYIEGKYVGGFAKADYAKEEKAIFDAAHSALKAEAEELTKIEDAKLSSKNAPSRR